MGEVPTMSGEGPTWRAESPTVGRIEQLTTSARKLQASIDAAGMGDPRDARLQADARTAERKRLHALPRLLDTIEALQGALSVESLMAAAHVDCQPANPLAPFTHTLGSHRQKAIRLHNALLAALKGDSE
jgi:hypothetical protein